MRDVIRDTTRNKIIFLCLNKMYALVDDVVLRHEEGKVVTPTPLPKPILKKPEEKKIPPRPVQRRRRDDRRVCRQPPFLMYFLLFILVLVFISYCR